MQTVTFPCEKCGNVIAVEQEFLGKPVSCPRCMQVTSAPNAPPKISSPLNADVEPAFSVPPAEEQESIFGDGCSPEDSLFDGVLDAKVEMPSHAIPTGNSSSDQLYQSSAGIQIERPGQGNLQRPESCAAEQVPLEHGAGPAAELIMPGSTGLPAPGAAPPSSPPVPGIDHSLAPSEPLTPSAQTDAPWIKGTDAAQSPSADFAVDVASPQFPEYAPSFTKELPSSKADASAGTSPFLGSSGAVPSDLKEGLGDLESGSLATIGAKKPARKEMAGGLFIALVLIPLISYAILATIAVVILFLRPPPEDPLERLPDLEGDYKGAAHEKHGSISYDRVSPKAELPAKLKVSLDHTIRVGEIEVTPIKVELFRIRIQHPQFATEPAGNEDSLVLRLRFRNVSKDETFTPLDPFFDRRWKGLSHGGKPYTFLQIGDKKLYGGPLPWKPGRPLDSRETIEGQDFRSLDPGHESISLVCTDPEEQVVRLLRAHSGPLLWRVQVRRGFVQVGEREISATAVVGVVFTEKDIQRPKKNS